VHVPYCAKACAYCDFYYKANLLRKPDYIKALLTEALLRLPANQSVFPVCTWYFGGGTPSLLTESDWCVILPHLSSLYPCHGEFTVEANPEDLSPAYLNMLQNLGVNRLSIGVQSFDDEMLRFMNRRHNAKRAIHAIEDARQAGFENISLDLIFGIPGYSTHQILRQIETACDLHPTHLSIYHLTIEPHTIFGLMNRKGELLPVTEDESREQYSAIVKLLASKGYLHYEISNYAQPGFESVHNSSYWASMPYIGLGPSAHSFDGHVRRWNVASTNRYIEGIKNHTDDWYETEKLSLQDMYNEYVMTRLRTSRGLQPSDIAALFGPDCFSHFKRQSRKHIESGSMVVFPDSHVRITEEAWLFSDYIISDLFLVSED